MTLSIVVALLVVAQIASLRLPATVIVLDSQDAMFADFVSVWRHAWPQLAPHRYRAIKDTVCRGEGLCKSILAVLERDQLYRPSATSFVLEPDALPFPVVNYTALAWDTSDARDVYFLGGHHVVVAPSQPVTAYWTPVRFIYGTYAMIISSRGRRKILPRLASYCTQNTTMLSIDVFLSNCFDAVIATPLLVDHPREGYSETWARNKTWPWAGTRQWWRTAEPLGRPKSPCLPQQSMPYK